MSLCNLLDMIYLQFSFYEKQMSQVLLWIFGTLFVRNSREIKSPNKS